MTIQTIELYRALRRHGYGAASALAIARVLVVFHKRQAGNAWCLAVDTKISANGFRVGLGDYYYDVVVIGDRAIGGD